MVWRDENAVAFLTLAPLRPGHILVVPVEEVDHWLDTKPATMYHLLTAARRIGQALQEIYQPEKVAMLIAGLEVPHLHLHLVPIWNISDLDWSMAQEVTAEERETEAAKIRSVLDTEHLGPKP